jgi:hypothetical protein
MPDLAMQPSSTVSTHAALRTAGRWMVSFVGFPLGGFAVMLTIGAVHNLPGALLGGLIAGTILGAAQSCAMGRGGPSAVRWITATAIGMTAGFTVGSAVVDYHTDLGSLAAQGAVTGLFVGAAQATVLWRRLGRQVLAWPPLLAACWALGWFVTTVAGISVDQQFIVFGSSGALVVTALTVVLPLRLRRTAGTAA